MEGNESDSETQLPIGTIKTPKYRQESSKHQGKHQGLYIYYLHVTKYFDPSRTRVEIVDFFSTRVSTPRLAQHY